MGRIYAQLRKRIAALFIENSYMSLLLVVLYRTAGNDAKTSEAMRALHQTAHDRSPPRAFANAASRIFLLRLSRSAPFSGLRLSILLVYIDTFGASKAI